MDAIQSERLFYFPICSNQEIDRILSVQNTDDYLLRLRANTVVDHMRLFRVMRNRCLKNEKDWNFTRSFKDEDFREYLALLPPEYKSKCEGIPAGYLFSNDPHGACRRTEYGDLIMVSNSIEYFLFYMNLSYVSFGIDVPASVRLAAQRIAIRTMLKSEALDFDMDPRGIIPTELEEMINFRVKSQLRFIIGHEYAHHIHGHLDGHNTIEVPLFFGFRGEEDYGLGRSYSNSEEQELFADVTSVDLPLEDEPDKANAAIDAITWFAYLDVWTQVSEQLLPTSPHRARTHPEPLERLWNLFDVFGPKLHLDKTSIDSFLAVTQQWKDFFQHDVAVNTDLYESYGSVYLAPPNTEWRGRALRDRVDYY
jgi:hypothetical protein